jgi:regulatory protein
VKRPPRSLKARALQLLAQREHSRSELRRKLLAHDADAGAAPAEEVGADRQDSVDAVLDWLEQHQFLSLERFVESRVHARAPRFGNLRIGQELARHQAAVPPDIAQRLRDTELERARAVWTRKFGQAAADPAGRARQSRFLAGRGFTGEVIARVLRDAALQAVNLAAPLDDD